MMIRTTRPVAAILACALLMGCAGSTGQSSSRAPGQTGTAAQDIRYFQAALERDPDNAAHRRALADAYSRASDLDGAREAYLTLIASEVANADDRIGLASVYLRQSESAEAKKVLSALPRGQGGARRALVEAMIADRDEDWDAADAAYDRAVKGSSAPAQALNNWGMSRLARGDRAGAEQRFSQAVSADPSLLIAVNNLGIVRAMQGEYRAPKTRVAKADRARLLFNMGLVAEAGGDRAAARQLFQSAQKTYPGRYPAAAERLARLSG